MPIYEYRCVDCGQEISQLQKTTDPNPVHCEKEMVRVISAMSISFKGEGFHVTDYKK